MLLAGKRNLRKLYTCKEDLRRLGSHQSSTAWYLLQLSFLCLILCKSETESLYSAFQDAQIDVRGIAPYN
jgi:hypothetical protein